MDLVLFSLRARLNGFFRQNKLQRVLLLGGGIVLSGFYGWLFSYMLEQAQNGGDTSVTEVIRYINLFVLGITIIRGFFPAYVPKLDLIPRLYPIKPLKRFWVELPVELFSPFNFVLVNFLFLLFILSPSYTFMYLLQSIIVLLTAHVTKRSLQVLVERKMRWLHLNFISAAVLAAAFVALQARLPMYIPANGWMELVVHLASLGAFLGANYFLELAAMEPKRKVVNYSHNKHRSLSWRLFKNSKQARQLLLFGIALKLIILAADAAVFTAKGIHIYDKNLTIWIFFGPAIIYSYVFNNVWGFYKNLWLTVERTSGSAKDFFKASLIPLRVPLLIDAALLAAYIAFFNHEDAVFLVLMYAASVLVLTPLGILASFVSPKVVKGSMMSFSAKTSYLYNMLSLLLVGLLLLPLLHPLLYILYPVLIAVAVFAMIAVLRESRRYKYELFGKLFKVDA
ncbi:hypothetical protein JAO76_00910 [Pontibacter sp. BT310]|jgi:hypothetical protein|uniref:Polysaccharide biosynthesis protein n=1 Tax=Pontibacter populi TaxID=890055 RepID=A0ABS6X6H0_9BACT|nr:MULTISPECIES: hypothetical protein [Pontibacter]MBJ6116731.1 hypothetical protein [Pontibacter sp. BT310]MBR0569155.1 hypothetical protein [Microvirga sp. STS03]MBW3363585.1 hypothetical protein [Pontibacter populi]